MDRPVINIDADNVLFDWSRAIRWYFYRQRGDSWPAEHTTWKVWEDMGVPKGQFDRTFREAVRDGLWQGFDSPARYVVEGAVEAMWELSDLEYHIRIVTHRLAHFGDYRKAVEDTVFWLDAVRIPYRSLAVIGNEPKSNYKAEILVDDAPHNILDWVANTGKRSIVFDQPWNQPFNPPWNRAVEGDLIYRAHSWSDVVNYVREFVK